MDIVIISRSESTVATLKELLKKEGFFVDVCPTVAEGMEACLSKKPKVALVDIEIVDRNFAEFIEGNPKVKMIFFVDKRDVDKNMFIEMFKHVPKVNVSFGYGELIDIVKKIAECYILSCRMCIPEDCSFCIVYCPKFCKDKCCYECSDVVYISKQRCVFHNGCEIDELKCSERKIINTK